MYENRRWPLPSDRIGPFEALDFTENVPLHNNDASVRKVTMYSKHTYTPLNKAKGRLVPLPTKYGFHDRAFRNVY